MSCRFSVGSAPYSCTVTHPHRINEVNNIAAPKTTRSIFSHLKIIGEPTLQKDISVLNLDIFNKCPTGIHLVVLTAFTEQIEGLNFP